MLCGRLGQYVIWWSYSRARHDGGASEDTVKGARPATESDTSPLTYATHVLVTTLHARLVQVEVGRGIMDCHTCGDAKEAGQKGGARWQVHRVHGAIQHLYTGGTFPTFTAARK